MPVLSTPIAVRALRLLFAVFGLAALLWIPIRDAAELSLSNYLSYFTIESNILAVTVLLIGAIRDPQSQAWQSIRGAVTLYMVITGIIYAVLLADIDVNLNDAWINSALHRILPLVMLLDWVFFASRHRISEARSLQWLLFPVVYGVYTLIRGSIVDWYPYPFMDPRHQGYLALFIGFVVLGIAMALMALAVNAVGRLGAGLRGRNAAKS
ncbi:Pr6Pr family membrane protein [Rhodococcus qingshengii]|uniref:Pr6Pr family membrane protein n=1 Tax=Rhodococcus qingshengii TaxID=334542 RepID=UPI0005AB8530|nr:Pr6Pr family membrane protein [Rhodococcus qingshengii]MCD2133800.1 Pr6Pr family membrane protein [Rhodococcus qingshengii]